MSRCFPFPPPGYEKKLRVENVTLLAKEKDKEKKDRKHKKDKNKEKKEGREKEKERSRERHKDKDKEKHKHKDRDKKSEKKLSHDEKRFEADRPVVEKVGSNSPQTILRVPDGDRGKAEVLEEVVSRSNGAYWNEGKGGLDQMAKGQMGNCHSKSPKVAFNFSDKEEQRAVQMDRPMENNIDKLAEGREMQKHHNSDKKGEKRNGNNTTETFGYDGVLIDPPKEAAVVQELKRRIRDENGATGSQGGANSNANSFSQTKENSITRNGSYRLENGQKDNNRAKVPRLAIVHHFKGQERGCEVAGAVDTSKKSLMEGGKRNGFCGKGVVDNRKIIQFVDKDRNELGKEEKVKEKTENVVGLSRFAENGSDSIDNSKHCTLKMGNKTAEVIVGKRKEPEPNGISHENETRPNKFQRTILSSHPATENGRILRACTTITLSASKQSPADGLMLDGEERKSNRTVGAQSPHVSTNSPSLSVKPMGITRAQSPLGSTRPIISANAKVGCQRSPFDQTKPPLSVGNAHGTAGSQESPSVSTTAVKVNGTIAAHGSPLGPTNLPSSIGKVHGTTVPREFPFVSATAGKVSKTEAAHGSLPNGTKGSQDFPLGSATVGKVNATISAHGSPPITTKVKQQMEKVHETVLCKETAKLPLTAGKVKGTIVAHGLSLRPTNPPSSIGKVHETTGSRDFPLVSSTTGKVNWTLGANGSPPITTKAPLVHEKVACQETAKLPLTAGKSNRSPTGAHGSPPITLKHPSTSRKEKRKDKSSSKPMPPHPDTKYLSRILSVPKMDELPEFDDPEWLFENKSCPLKEREVGYGRDGGEQVWAKTVHIESEDVYALPYVIPY